MNKVKHLFLILLSVHVHLIQLVAQKFHTLPLSEVHIKDIYFVTKIF